MSVPVNIDEYKKLLPMSVDELSTQAVPAHVIERVKRMRALYAFWIQFPNLFASDIVQQDITMFGVAKSEAYDDIHLVKIILGDLQAATKDFVRWKVTQMLIEDRASARRANDFRAAVAADDKIGKYHRLDKEDTPDLAFDKIVPQVIEPSDDPSVIGLPKIKNLREKIKKMKEKYLKDGFDGAYTDYEEVEEGEQNDGT